MLWKCLATGLRHSAKQVQWTYDRCTANKKKQLAANQAQQYAESELEQPECTSNTDKSAVPVEEWQFKPVFTFAILLIPPKTTTPSTLSVYLHQ